MRIGFRAWMTAAALFVVVLTVASMLLYALPVAGERLEGYELDRLTAQAAQTADAIAEGEGRDLERALDLAADPDEREALFVDRDGRVAGRAGPELLEDDPAILGEAAGGDRLFEEVDGLDVAAVPVFYGGELRGGVVLASSRTGGVFGAFLRSSVEAAVLASVLGGGLMLLLASLLGRRVERISSGARAVERGDLSHRIEPGFGDELGELAGTFNAMAERLRCSFSRLEERVAERTAELETERARLEAVLRQMPSGVVIAEAPSGKVVLSNERAGRIRGRSLPPYVGPRKRDDDYEVFFPDGRPYAPEQWPLARTIRTGEEVHDEEVVIARGDGERVTVLVSSSPIRDREENIVAGVAVFYDVTEQKRAEKEIRRLTLRNESILRSAGEGIFGLDLEGKTAFVNPAAAGMLGYEPGELLGRRAHDLVHHSRPDGSPYPAEECPVYAALREGETRRVDAEVFWRKDGTSFPVEYVSTPVKEGGRVSGTVVVFGDVTERREAEEEIRRLNEGLEERVRERTAELERERRRRDVVLDNLSEGVMAVDAEGRMVFANPTARCMLGNDGGGTPEGVPDPWDDFDLPLAVSRASEGGEGIVARVGGSRTPLLEVRLRPLPPEDDGGAEGGAYGGAGGVLVVAQDLSEGWRLEERQQRFLADAAHELKTPLTAILGAAELLEEDDETDPGIRRRFLGRIHSEARHMTRLSETLLRLARTGADLREPELRPVEMGFLEEVAERAEPLAEGAGLELVMENRGGLVLADAEWLEQALLILVSNAVKHSGRGNRVWLRADGGAFEVEDEGEGISEADLPHVFERHYRGEGASSGGFGLGLPICKELVERMGGEISVESEEGVGTTARIRLPEVGTDG